MICLQVFCLSVCIVFMNFNSILSRSLSKWDFIYSDCGLECDLFCLGAMKNHTGNFTNIVASSSAHYFAICHETFNVILPCRKILCTRVLSSDNFAKLYFTSWILNSSCGWHTVWRYCMALRREALSLYKRILRISCAWEASTKLKEDTRIEREYIRNEARALFMKNKHVRNKKWSWFFSTIFRNLKSFSTHIKFLWKLYFATP